MAIKVKKRVVGDGRTRYTATYQLTDGTWRSAGTFGSESLAKKAARKGETEVEEGLNGDPRQAKATLRDRWVEFVQPSLFSRTPNTRVYYEGAWRLWVDRKWEHEGRSINIAEIPLRRITTDTVQLWIDLMVANGKNATSITKVHKMVSMMLRQAVDAGVIKTNPARGRRLPPIIEPDVKIMTPEEFRSFLEHVPEWAQCIVRLGIETGMRYGELAGLTPCQIDTFNHVIRVDRTLVEISSKATGNGSRYYRKPLPKGGKPRYIQISQEVFDLLKAEIIKRGITWDSDREIFTDPRVRESNAPLSRKGFWHMVHDALVAAGLGSKGYSFKHLRSSCASWTLAADRENLLAVQQKLGHADLKTTMKYLQTLPEAETTALAGLHRIMNRGLEQATPEVAEVTPIPLIEQVG